MIRTHAVPAQQPGGRYLIGQGDVIRFTREGVRTRRPSNYIEGWGVVEAVNRRTYRVRTASGQQARVPRKNVFLVLPKRVASRRLEICAGAGAMEAA